MSTEPKKQYCVTITETMQKQYCVTITETMQKQVMIEASSAIEAENIAEQKYRAEEIIISPDSFVGVTFEAGL